MLTYNKEEAAKKLNSYIEAGRESALNVITEVQNNQPVDTLVSVENMKFVAEGEVLKLRNNKTEESFSLHKNALSQIATTAGLPIGFAEKMRSTDWGAALIAHNLQEIFSNSFELSKTFLTRSLGGQIRGFLSNRYRRIDSRPLVEQFTESVAAAGALPYKGTVTDTRIDIAAIFPEVYEIVPGELIAFGATFNNSDYGNGAASVRQHILRIWCDNLMVTQESMREVHLGKKLSDEIIFSQETYRLDAETTRSALKDVMANVITKEAIDAKVTSIKAANEAVVTLDDVRKMFKQMASDGKLNKLEAEKASQVFELGGMDSVPEKPSLWKMSNSLAWVAKEATPERRLELNRMAGSLLPSL